MGAVDHFQHTVIDEHSFWWGEYMAQYRFASRFAKGAKVLDVGCGRGRGSRFLFDQGAIEVIGMDINSSDILRAQQEQGRDGVGFLVGDMKTMPFAQKSFDLVTCFQVMEKVGDIDAALSQASKVLVPEGQMILTTVNRKRFSTLSEAPVESSHMQEYDLDELKNLLKRHFTHCDIQGIFCTRLTGAEWFSSQNKTVEFFRRQLENRIPWKLKDVLAQSVFGVSYYPGVDEYVLRSIGIQEAPLFYAVCRK